ncbi:MAG: DHHA1 domain-containing protein [Ruthenibacterium lactatiformans]
MLSGRGYHQGVIGIVASRVVERFGKPAIIVSVDENGEGKGSGRSIAGVSLYNAIAACGDLLIRFGGHALAAGLSVREENLPAFRKAVNAWAAQEHPVLKRPALRLDAPLALSGLKEEDVAALSVLAPFGHGNPTPVFLWKRCDRRSISPQRGQAHAPAPEAGRRSAVCGGVRPGAGRAGLQCG